MTSHSNGPLVNPEPEPETQDVVPRAFHNEMVRRARRDGQRPLVTVLIQARGHTLPVDDYRERLTRAIAHMRARGVPKDERGPVLARAVEEAGGSRKWHDVEVYWHGRYEPSEIEMPSAAKLEAVEDKLGADEARVVVRTAT